MGDLSLPYVACDFSPCLPFVPAGQVLLLTSPWPYPPWAEGIQWALIAFFALEQVPNT